MSLKSLRAQRTLAIDLISVKIVAGGAVPTLFRSSDKYWIPVAALDQAPDTKISNHIHVPSRACWDEIGGKGDQHEEFSRLANKKSFKLIRSKAGP